jgi:hypothetical protein
MYRVLPQILAADHITELYREAERERLARELRDGSGQRPRRRRGIRRRLPFRQPRPAGA